jgi:hypothetical protein
MICPARVLLFEQYDDEGPAPALPFSTRVPRRVVVHSRRSAIEFPTKPEGGPHARLHAAANFALTIPVDEYERVVTPVAHAIAAVDGLRWKVWIVNAAEAEAGGFYHFDSEAAAEAYIDGPIISALRAAPFQRNLTVKRFGYLPGPTMIDHGPVDADAPAIMPSAVVADMPHVVTGAIPMDHGMMAPPPPA